MNALQVAALVLAVAATVAGVGVFARGATTIVRTVRVGTPAPDRHRRPWRRTWVALATVVGHRRFRNRPAVVVAHWFVMLSFPVLFLTLVSSYGQIVDPRFSLPLVGHWAPLEWLTEVLAWGSLVGIVLLVAVRQREHPRRSRAAAPSAARTPESGPPGSRASRFFGSNLGQAYFVEAVVGAVVLAVLGLRGLECALALQDAGFQDLSGGIPPWTGPDAAAWTSSTPEPPDVGSVLWHYPLTAWFGAAWVSVQTATLETAVVLLALVKIAVSMSWMVVTGLQPAMGVSWHRFLAVVNVWARREADGSPALGPLPPVRAGGVPVDFDALDALPDDARLGVGRIEDFTWKGLLDFSTCTECGRCQEQCPAWNTGKPLSPKLVVLALRDHAYATSTAAAASAADADAHAALDVLSLVGDVIDPEALWACTMCGACVHQCPVDIEHIDHIADLRRNQVLMESAFPTELGSMFTGLERQGNPWGLPARRRMDWAVGLDFPVPVIGKDVDDAANLDYLFWVGCAGAYDDGARATTRAVAELLHIAGVSFAVLGEAEGCSGDPARRAGNELLFQMIARATIDTLTAAKVTRVVVRCPHCLNALAREYPQLGGRFEVIHHVELLDRLVAEGRLTPVADRAPEPVADAVAGPVADPAADPTPDATTDPVADPAADPTPDATTTGTLTYHDPCYLGRHNGIYTPPRDLLAATGAIVREMPRAGDQSFCCGGGGARMWLEEKTGTRISADRAAEAVATGADRVATACPFCAVMLGGGMAGAPHRIEVVDVAQVLLESVRPAKREPRQPTP